MLTGGTLSSEAKGLTLEAESRKEAGWVILRKDSSVKKESLVPSRLSVHLGHAHIAGIG